MTECRPPYDAYSSTTDTRPIDYDTALALEGRYTPLLQTKPDVLLLLPILQSPDTPEEDAVCFHLVNLPEGLLGLCNSKTEQCCPCCGFAMCQRHTSDCLIELPDTEGIWSEDSTALLCETCAALSPEQIYTFHAFRTSINQ